MDGYDVARYAAQAAGRGLMLKAVAVVAALGMVGLLLLGLIAGGTGTASAAGSPCGGLGTPGAPLPGGSNGGSTGGASGTPHYPGGPMRAKQIENATTIDRIAQEGGLPGRATLIGLMTALQESTLLDLPGGDRDSIGLFQQRPSMGWGTVDQIKGHPDYQARMFFYGSPTGDPRGLTGVRYWQDMPLGQAAQAVQHSAYPTLYDRQEQGAREIAAQAGIDLNRAATAATGTAAATPGNVNATTGNGSCFPEAPSKPGAPFHDSASAWPDTVKNPRDTAGAVAWERNEAANGPGKWKAMCLASTAVAYGWGYAGYTNPPTNTHAWAIEHYRNIIPAAWRHDGDRNPPPGALVYWDTGGQYGHVAVYIGDGKVASTDILRPGYIDIVPAETIETKWGAKYLGWAPPYFPAGG
ncbi:peptidase M23 [Kitasatospora sp. NPDC058063]|uniref:peptidase M23 n=1 Tax=unclassified Kitasatospora TaxID=2633591 RepID=UPI0036DB423A